jgi:hypothetical protein
MNEPPIPYEIKQWLKMATNHLPEPARRLTYQELENHYLDANKIHQARGLSAQEAQILALAELGDAASLATDLQSVHFSSRRAFTVMLACLAYPISLYLMQTLMFYLPVQLVNLLLIILTSIIILFVIHAVKTLLAPIHGTISLPIKLLTIAQILWMLGPVISYFLFAQLPLMDASGRLFIETGNPIMAALNFLTLSGEGLSAIGTLWLGILLTRNPQVLWRLCGAGLSAIGIMTFVLCAAVLSHAEMLAHLASAINFVLLTIVLCLLSYIFFKVATHGLYIPLKTT